MDSRENSESAATESDTLVDDPPITCSDHATMRVNQSNEGNSTENRTMESERIESDLLCDSSHEQNFFEPYFVEEDERDELEDDNVLSEESNCLSDEAKLPSLIDQLSGEVTLDDTDEAGIKNQESQKEIDKIKYLITSRDLNGLESYLDENEEHVNDVFQESIDKGESIVTMTCTLGLQDVIELFDRKCLLFNIQDSEGYYPIHRAAYNHHVRLVECLADRFGDDSLLNCTRSGLNVLHICASVGDVELIQLLVPRMHDIDLKCNQGWSALHIATQCAYVKAVEVLLDGGADIDNINKNGDTSLILATERGHTELVQLFIDRGAKLNIQNIRGVSALYLAVQNNRLELVKLLIKAGANVNAQDKFGWCPLHKATSMADQDLVFQLVNNSAETNLRNRNGVTCLHLCVSQKKKESSKVCAQLLLMHGANCNIKDNLGITPFLGAVKSRYSDIIHLMIQHKADLTLTDTNKNSPLLMACANGDHSIASKLLKANAFVNQINSRCDSCLHIVTKTNDSTLCKMLIHAGGDLCLPDRMGVTPLALAARLKKTDILNVMVSRGVTPLMMYKVAMLGKVELMRSVQDASALCLRATDHNAKTCLHLAAEGGSAKAIHTLLSCIGSTQLLGLQDKAGNTALHRACLYGHHTSVKLLLSAQAPLHIRNYKMQSCLHFAAKSGNAQVIDALLQRGAGVNDKDDIDNSPICVAVYCQKPQAVERLLQANADLNSPNKHGLYPIHIAAKRGCTDILFQLLKHGQSAEKRSMMKKTCLHLAAEAGHLATVLELVTSGADVNAQNVLGKKPLHLAAYAGHTGIVEALLSAGTTICLLETDGCPMYDLARHEELWNLMVAWFRQNPEGLISNVSWEGFLSHWLSVSEHRGDEVGDVPGLSRVETIVRQYLFNDVIPSQSTLTELEAFLNQQDES